MTALRAEQAAIASRTRPAKFDPVPRPPRNDPDPVDDGPDPTVLDLLARMGAGELAPSDFITETGGRADV